MNAKRTYETVDPNGVKHQIISTRVIGFSVFHLHDGKYAVRFCKTLNAARAVWGNKGIPGKAYEVIK